MWINWDYRSSEFFVFSWMVNELFLLSWSWLCSTCIYWRKAQALDNLKLFLFSFDHFLCILSNTSNNMNKVYSASLLMNMYFFKWDKKVKGCVMNHTQLNKSNLFKIHLLLRVCLCSDHLLTYDFGNKSVCLFIYILMW